MRSDPARYDVAPRGSAAAREYEEESRHLMHVKADPRNDVLNDGSGHNPDGDGQTMIGIEIKERFSDMRTAFLKLDADFDGCLTHEELMQACIEWNIPLSEATRVMNSVDVDQKGFIDFDEFARRFDPVLEVSPDDEELLRLYQEGIMGNEEPIVLSKVQHGTSTAEPFVDEAKHYRTQNGDMRGRLARAMQSISDLQKDLKASRDHAAALEVSLENEQAANHDLRGRNAELEGCLSVVRKQLKEAEDDKRRMRREIDCFWGDESGSIRRQESEERRRRTRQVSFEDDETEAAMRARLLERQMAEEDSARRRQEAARRQEDDERNTVFVYGLEDCQKTEALMKALDKAKVPYTMRDFTKDKRYMEAARKSGFDNSSALYAPVVCLADKAWWKNHEENYELIPFPQATAMELRRELGMNLPTPEKVREDIDIDMEIYQRFLTMQDAFLKLDDNQDGFITEEEIAAKCQLWNIPVSEAGRIIAEADKDGKGFLTFDEFAKRFGGIWNRGSRGPLRSLAPAPNQPRPHTSPIVNR
jgi:Ca2+-binding EF-hand superfamily protein